jgi:hypothetical protein
VKTVEGHLSRACTKLGTDGRGQLHRVLDADKTRAPTLWFDRLLVLEQLGVSPAPG